MKKSTIFAVSVTVAVCLLALSNTVRAQLADDVDYSKGITSFYDGKYDDALKEFEAACKAAPKDPLPYYYKGLCVLRLGDRAAAQDLFKIGGYYEYTAKGRLTNVNRALRRVQGPERALIEEGRLAGKRYWEKQEQRRQLAQYGEVRNRERQMLGSGAVPQGSATASAASDPLPAFAPIRPYTEKGETEVAKVPNLTDEKNDEFEFFRDEIGKTSRSTAEQARLKELESRVVYENPMDRPAKDGQRFVNVFDPGEIHVDTEPFWGSDDSDDAYKEFEGSPVAGGINLLESAIRSQGGKITPVTAGKKKKTPGAMGEPGGMGMGQPGMDDPNAGMMGPDPNMMGPDPGMMGSDGQSSAAGATGVEPVFGSDKGSNPFSGKKVTVPDPATQLDLFKGDLAFDSQPAQTGQPATPGMGPEGSPSPSP